MDDEVVDALDRQIEAIDRQIEDKEKLLQRQQNANSDLLKMLVKSVPVDSKALGAWAKNTQAHKIQTSAFSLPELSRDAWISCPLESADQWVHVVKDKVVIGVEVENLDFGGYITDIHGAVLMVLKDNQEWSTSSSCLLKFGESDLLWPQVSTALKPRNKAFLVVSTCVPSNLLSSELILICQASVRQNVVKGTKILPPILDPQKWKYWSGELARTTKNTFDVYGGRAPIIASLGDTFDTLLLANDAKKFRKCLASIYACQEKKWCRLEIANLELAKILGNTKLKLKNVWSSHDEAKYCQLPLFDGIMIFLNTNDLSAKNTQVEFLITGWTSVQIEQFIAFMNSHWQSATVELVKEEQEQELSGSNRDLDDNCSKILDLVKCGKNLEEDKTVKVVNGDEYRELRMEMCTAEVLRHL